MTSKNLYVKYNRVVNIEDLLLYSVSANENIEKESVSLNELVKISLSDLSETIESRQAVIKVNSLPIVACDKRVMGQVFVNIIGNSLKYVDAEQVPKIWITSKTLKSHTKIEFRDNGIGMNLKPSLNIFDPFTRLHSKSEYEGSGIGLAICKSICDRHGWTIEVKSKMGEGTRMIVSIPNTDIRTK